MIPLYRFFDAITIPALRPAMTSISRWINQATGVPFHPVVWQLSAMLAGALAFYFFYVAIRAAKA